MNNKEFNQKLRDIVKTWNINLTSEYQYREFRCGNCQKPLRKAWHIWLLNEKHLVEVHLCKKCYKELNNLPSKVIAKTMKHEIIDR